MECLTLNKQNCKSCRKCIRHCPVKSIRFTGEQAHIIHEDCILCGQCFVVCPHDAKQIVSEVEKVKMFINSGESVFVSLAPSFVANYEGVGIEAMREALIKLGFTDAEETAIGATHVKNEYDRIMASEKNNVVISSCCHSINLLIQKYYPSERHLLADVISPMQAHCKDIKRRFPEAKTVFIGPCISKKDEAEHYKGIVDAVLTFDELSAWLKEAGIEPEKKIIPNDESRSRYFPTVGGILKTLNRDNPKYTFMAIDGVQNCIVALDAIHNNKITNCFIEMSACEGSCIGGPIMEKSKRSPVLDYSTVAQYAGQKDFTVKQPPREEMVKNFSAFERRYPMPNEAEIRAILKQTGKNTPDDELNCGSCGYDTCREKAIAVYQGKAELSLCLPYLRDKAESFSDMIVRDSPDGMLVLNEKLEVQQINKAAVRILNLRYASDILGDQVVRILDPIDFIDVLDTGRNLYNKRTYLAEYEKYVEQTIVYDREYRSIICILRDVTEEENQRHRKEKIRMQTTDIADKVVDRQMRIVQEIASLLGETAAETKIALTKLKESIQDE